jgi:hypothetical protein
MAGRVQNKKGKRQSERKRNALKRQAIALGLVLGVNAVASCKRAGPALAPGEMSCA